MDEYGKVTFHPHYPSIHPSCMCMHEIYRCSHTSIGVGHAFDGELVRLDVHDRHTRLLAYSALQVTIACGHNVALLLRSGKQWKTENEKVNAKKFKSNFVSFQCLQKCNVKWVVKMTGKVWWKDRKSPRLNLRDAFDQAVIGVGAFVTAHQTLKTRVLGHSVKRGI